MSFRVGHGFDVHAFEEGDHIILGGVSIPFNKSLKAHSDGDVLLHAVCDALLGAAALGDIGKHFPDTDEQYRNIDSRALLRNVFSLLQKHCFVLENLDVTVIAEKPRLSGFTDLMRKNLSEDLGVDVSQVNVKATTTEGLGFTGREEGIAAHAHVLVKKV